MFDINLLTRNNLNKFKFKRRNFNENTVFEEPQGPRRRWNYRETVKKHWK